MGLLVKFAACMPAFRDRLRVGTDPSGDGTGDLSNIRLGFAIARTMYFPSFFASIRQLEQSQTLQAKLDGQATGQYG